MRSVFVSAVSAAWLAVSVSCAWAQFPQPAPFSYQGELASGGTPASGLYDFRFRLFESLNGGSQIASTLCVDNVSVTGGKFTVSLDFGAVFAGENRFLEIEARQDSGLNCSNAAGFTVLSPRQELTATPHALFASSAKSAESATTAARALVASNATSLNGQAASFYTNAANLTGTISDARLSPNIARLDSNQTFTGQVLLTNPTNSFAGNGSALTNLNGQALSFGSVSRNSLSGDTRLSLPTFFGDWTRTPYVPLGMALLDTPGTAIAVSLNTACVGTSTSLSVFNTSDFTQPRLLGSVPMDVRGVSISGSRAFVVTANQLVIVDFSQPANPVRIGAIDTVCVPKTVSLAGSIAVVAGNLVNSSSPGFLEIYDVSNPVLPIRLSGVSSGGIAKSAAVSGSFAYVVSEVTNTLRIYDISNPAQPALVGTATYGRAAENIAVSGGFAYVTLTGVGQVPSNSLIVYDVSNPSAPLLVGSTPTGTVPTGLVISGNLAFVSGLLTGVQVYNVATPSSPTRIGSISTAGDAYGIAVNNFAFVVTNTSQLQVLAGAPGYSLQFPLTAELNGNATSATNASQLGGRAPSFYSDAANLSSGVLSNSRTSGTANPTSNTLVLRDASGNFSAGTITANLIGNATNATQLNGQPASFYSNAGNISTGTLGDARLSTNIPRLASNNTFTGTQNSFSGKIGVNTPAGGAELDVNGRVNVAQGVIQKDVAGGIITATNDLGLYSQVPGGWIRLVTNGGQFAWFSDSGAGTQERMILSPAGNLFVIGAVSKAGGSFKIDHPLDPENKYLYHSFVESPDMMNIYNGNAVTDGAGIAVIQLPDYFEALNRDFRYQLTVLDDSDENFVLAKVYREIGVAAPRQFTIKTSRPGTKVSWQVTGIRKDAWAEKNRIPNSVDKPAAEKGKYLHPEAFGKPAGQSVQSLPPETDARLANPR